jgi:hypothetical protein
MEFKIITSFEQTSLLIFIGVSQYVQSLPAGRRGITAVKMCEGTTADSSMQPVSKQKKLLPQLLCFNLFINFYSFFSPPSFGLFGRC